MVKKGKATTSKKSNMIPLFSDTTYNRDRGTTSWEAMSNLLEEENPKPLVTKETVGAQESSDSSYFEVTCSFLHQIATRTKILPYKDMVNWVIDGVGVLDRTLRNKRQEFMGSFTPNNLRLMC